MSSSIFNIKADFKKSKNSFIYDLNKSKFFLDFFGLYSTNVLGYSNKILRNKKNDKIILNNFHLKFPTSEITTIDTEIFKKNFYKDAGLNKYFSYVNFFSTGALAVESAIKTAIYSRNYKSKIITFKNSFHGINSYGGIISDRSINSTKQRLGKFPGNYYKNFDCFYDERYHKNKKSLTNVIDQISYEFKNNSKKISCCIIEPIQCTAGDLYIDKSFLQILRKLTKEYRIPLIFDEIQTGFYTSCKTWYYQYCNVIPDILVFGKKSQVSGIAVSKKFSQIINNTKMLDVTFNSDHLDMIRCNMIHNYIKKNNLLEKRNIVSNYFYDKLSKIYFIKNLRSNGSLFAFDLKNKILRDKIFKFLYKYGIIVNISGSNTIRIRLNLLIKKSECNIFISTLKKSYEKSKIK